MQAAAKTRQPLRSLDDLATGQVWDLRLTLVFHPNLGRVGASLSLGSWASDGGFLLSATVLGRNSPEFSDLEPINDPYVSRRAMSIARHSTGLKIQNLSEVSKLRLGPDGSNSMSLSVDELKQGVGVRLGHAVVGWLRLSPQQHTDISPQVSGLFSGVSSEAKRVQHLIQLAADSSLPVLLLGKTGAGKEVAANAIHRLSSRMSAPFEQVNMAGITESLAEAELFGTSRGAFTGAVQRQGIFSRANGGTLFLDEVGDTAPHLQPKLLRTLEQGEIQVVGGRSERVDVRIIAATELDVEQEQGFRQSLLHRLSGIVIKIPSLEDRREDIGVLAAPCLTEASGEGSGASLLDLSESPRKAAAWGQFFFKSLYQSWPGNVRELLLAVRRQSLQIEEIESLYDDSERNKVSARPAQVSDSQLLAVHQDADYEVAETARRLSLSRQAVYRRLEKLPDTRIASQISDRELIVLIGRFGRDAKQISSFAGVSQRAIRQRLIRLERDL